jgi:hypothetical protein
MVDPLTLQSISILISGLGIVVAIIYYAQVLRNTSKARQRELIFQRFQGYSKEYVNTYFKVSNMTEWTDAEDWRRKYGKDVNVEADADWTYIMSIYNIAGILLQEEETDPELIFKLYPPHVVIRLWEGFEPVIQALREKTHTGHLEPFEYLYREAKKRYPDIQPWEKP